MGVYFEGKAGESATADFVQLTNALAFTGHSLVCNGGPGIHDCIKISTAADQLHVDGRVTGGIVTNGIDNTISGQTITTNNGFRYEYYGSSSTGANYDGVQGWAKIFEAAAPSGVSGQEVVYADSTAHRLKVNNNNGGATNLLTAAAGNGQAAAWAGTTATITSGTNDYVSFGQNAGQSVIGTEANAQTGWPLAGTASNLQCKWTTAAQAGGVIFVVRKNGVDTALTFTATSGTSNSDTTHTFSVAANDLLDVHITNGNASNATGVASCSFMING